MSVRRDQSAGQARLAKFVQSGALGEAKKSLFLAVLADLVGPALRFAS